MSLAYIWFMEKLFGSKNIRIQPIRDLYESETNIAYTDKLLKLNVFLEFFGVAIADDSSIPEETAVFAHHFDNDVVYSYVLFVSAQILGPLPVFRIIADAIEFIEMHDQRSANENLKAIATSYEILDHKHNNKKYYQNVIFKKRKALELIHEKQGNIN